MLLFNIPMSALNTRLNAFLEGLSGTNAAILGVIVGSMMAIDLGGQLIRRPTYLQQERLLQLVLVEVR